MWRHIHNEEILKYIYILQARPMWVNNAQEEKYKNINVWNVREDKKEENFY